MISGCRTTWGFVALCCVCQSTVCAGANASPNITFNNILRYGSVVRARPPQWCFTIKVFMHSLCRSLRPVQALEIDFPELCKLHVALCPFTVCAGHTIRPLSTGARDYFGQVCADLKLLWSGEQPQLIMCAGLLGPSYCHSQPTSQTPSWLRSQDFMQLSASMSQISPLPRARQHLRRSTLAQV